MEIVTIPSPLHRAEVCPGEVVKLRCIARNLLTDTLRWFLCVDNDCSRQYAAKILSLSNEGPVIYSLPLIPGIEITLESLSRESDPLYVNFVSTMTVNASVFDTHAQQVTSFRCGSLEVMSNNVSLSFTILG